MRLFLPIETVYLFQIESAKVGVNFLFSSFMLYHLPFVRLTIVLMRTLERWQSTVDGIHRCETANLYYRPMNVDDSRAELNVFHYLLERNRLNGIFYFRSKFGSYLPSTCDCLQSYFSLLTILATAKLRIWCICLSLFRLMENSSTEKCWFILWVLRIHCPVLQTIPFCINQCRQRSHYKSFSPNSFISFTTSKLYVVNGMQVERSIAIAWKAVLPKDTPSIDRSIWNTEHSGLLSAFTQNVPV